MVEPPDKKIDYINWMEVKINKFSDESFTDMYGVAGIISEDNINKKDMITYSPECSSNRTECSSNRNYFQELCLFQS